MASAQTASERRTKHSQRGRSRQLHDAHSVKTTNSHYIDRKSTQAVGRPRVSTREFFGRRSPVLPDPWAAPGVWGHTKYEATWTAPRRAGTSGGGMRLRAATKARSAAARQHGHFDPSTPPPCTRRALLSSHLPARDIIAPCYFTHARRVGHGVQSLCPRWWVLLLCSTMMLLLLLLPALPQPA